MEKHFLFMRTVLSWLAVPRHFNRLISVTLRVVAALVVPLGLVAIFKAGKVVFELPASSILGGLFFMLLFALAVYAVVHGLFLRAADIDRLAGGEYNMFPLAAIVARTLGEVFAAFIGVVAVGGGIFVWFTGKSVNTILNPLPVFMPTFGDTTFMGGIEFMVGGVLSAIAALAAAYLVAEIFKLLFRAAQHVAVEERGDNGVAGYKLRTGTGS